MTTAEARYAGALADAIAEDLLHHPVPGDLLRIVIRWNEAAEPLYLAIHALGADEREEVFDGDAWYPLEWPDVDREDPRATRITAQQAVREAGEALAAEYVDLPDVSDGVWTASPAVIETVRRLQAALEAGGVVLHEHFAATAAHFEGQGAEHVFEQVANPETAAALKALGELPDPD